jgi:HAD superfamily hydrolase (TIGR01509 family)
MLSIQMVWFDMGNVLLRFCRERQAKSLRRLPGCRREVAEIIPFIDGRSDEHIAFELGELDREAFLARLARFLGTDARHEKVEDAYATLFTRHEAVCQLAAKIAQTTPIGLATNSDHLHLRRARRDYPQTMSLFTPERTVASCDCGYRKPSRGFFECMIAKSGCMASELCFIDDMAANIVGAKQAGIGQMIEFNGNIDSLRTRLSSLGIQV